MEAREISATPDQASVQPLDRQPVGVSAGLWQEESRTSEDVARLTQVRDLRLPRVASSA